MARLPSAADLGPPGSFRSGRTYASADASAAGRGLSQLGAGLQNLSVDLQQAEEKKRRESLIADAPPVDAAYKTEFYNFLRELDSDTDFGTHGKRIDDWVKGNVPQYGAGIRDEKGRKSWQNEAMAWTVGQQANFLNRSADRAKDKQRVNIITALDQYRNIYVDPSKDDGAREAARADIAATIDAAEQSGLMTPEQAYSLRKTNLEDAETTFAKLWYDANPQAAVAPLKPSTFDQRLANSESGGRPGIINRLGYVGKYQFGAPRLATLGIYNTDENLSGWSKRAGTTGKWTGEFNIPGFPEVKTLQDFRASPEAQDAAYQIHKQKMDQEIEQFGLTGFIGQSVAGTVVTREGIYAMMHLGGAKGASDALKSGGTKNAKDENGTSLLDYLKMGAGGSNNPALPPNFDRMNPVQQAEISDYRGRVAASIEQASEENAKAVRASVEREGYDLVFSDELTPEWFEANKDDLGIQAYKTFARALVPSEDPIRTDPNEYLRLMELADTAPEQAMEEVKQAYADRSIAKDVFNRVYSMANGNIRDEARRPYVSQIRGFVDKSLRPPEGASKSALARHLDTMFLFDDWVAQNPGASREETRKFADDLTTNQRVMLREEKKRTIPVPSSLRATPRELITEDALARAKAWTSLNLQLGGMTEEQAAREADTIRQWLELLSDKNGR